MKKHELAAALGWVISCLIAEDGEKEAELFLLLQEDETMQKITLSFLEAHRNMKLQDTFFPK